MGQKPNDKILLARSRYGSMHCLVWDAGQSRGSAEMQALWMELPSLCGACPALSWAPLELSHAGG